MTDNDRRILTDRQAAAAELIARIPPRRGGTPTFAGQVYSGGSMPTTTPAWFLTHPVEFDCEEAEGGPCEQDADEDSSIPVLVLGKAPSSGDVLIAEMIGGRWVAERSGQPPPKCFWFCGPHIFIAAPSNPACHGAAATMVVAPDGSISSISLTYGGDGCYTSNPAVVFGGPGAGSGATAIAIVGQLQAIVLTNWGSGYDPDNPPKVTIAAPGGAGTQATATVTVDGATGSLNGITLTGRGSLYPVADPAVTIDPPPDPKGVQATGAATARPGVVTSLILTDPGSGFESNVPPPYLNVTVACAAWSVPVRIYLLPFNATSPGPPDYGVLNPCNYAGSTVFDFPGTGFTSEVRGVKVSVTAGYGYGVGWVAGVAFGIQNDFNQQAPIHDCAGISHPPILVSPPDGYIPAYDGDGVALGVIASSTLTQSFSGSPLDADGNGACDGRPYSGTFTYYLGVQGGAFCMPTGNGSWTYDLFVKSPFLYANALYTLAGAQYRTLVQGGPGYQPIPITVTLSEP